jgi:hypothetical protein
MRRDAVGEGAHGGGVAGGGEGGCCEGQVPGDHAGLVAGAGVAGPVVIGHFHEVACGLAGPAARPERDSPEREDQAVAVDTISPSQISLAPARRAASAVAARTGSPAPGNSSSSLKSRRRRGRGPARGSWPACRARAARAARCPATGSSRSRPRAAVNPRPSRNDPSHATSRSVTDERPAIAGVSGPCAHRRMRCASGDRSLPAADPRTMLSPWRNAFSSSMTIHRSARLCWRRSGRAGRADCRER